MYKNIGKKIKTLAKVLAWIGIVLTVILGISAIMLDLGRTQATVIGACYLFLGPVFSWLGSLVLYGFGQLVDNSDRIANHLAPEVSAVKARKQQPEPDETVEDLPERLCSECGRILREDDCPFCGHINAPQKQNGEHIF